MIATTKAKNSRHRINDIALKIRANNRISKNMDMSPTSGGISISKGACRVMNVHRAGM
jgi:hypothetical protein